MAIRINHKCQHFTHYFRLFPTKNKKTGPWQPKFTWRISQQDEILLVRQSLPQPTKQPRVEIAEGVCSEIRPVVAQPVVVLAQQSDNTLLINTLNENASHALRSHCPTRSQNLHGDTRTSSSWASFCSSAPRLTRELDVNSRGESAEEEAGMGKKKSSGKKKKSGSKKG
jgi:hypothetical protein